MICFLLFIQPKGSKQAVNGYAWRILWCNNIITQNFTVFSAAHVHLENKIGKIEPVLFPPVTSVLKHFNLILNRNYSLNSKVHSPQTTSTRICQSVLGQDWSQIKKKSVLVLVLHAVALVLQVWCCETHFVMLVIIMILKNTATFQVQFIVSLFCA